MKCPQCRAATGILSTRERKDGSILRRRQCAQGHRFSTYEFPVKQPKEIK